jgi:hypothetical protein
MAILKGKKSLLLVLEMILSFPALCVLVMLSCPGLWFDVLV